MTDTNELRKLLAAATPTPWAVSHGDESWEVVQTKPDGTPDFGARRTAFDDGSAGGEYGPSCNTLTRDLIVAAVNALPSLLDELDALRARIKSLEGCIVRNMEAAISRIPKAGAARVDPVMAALARASQERDDARADLREAMELLDMAEVPPDHENGGYLEIWNHRRAVLRGVVEKRKETP